MASAYYSNTQHIDFESVLAMDDPVIYEAALVDFFEKASVRDGVIISTVAVQLVEISEEWFVESFDLPVDGLSELSEIPKDVVFDARSIISMSGEPVSLSGKKSQMKIEYRLLCDIMAKSISVKAGSFNAITVEKFSLLSAVVCGVRMNWSSVLFNILKKMVTAGSKQAKVFAVQISLLRENIPNLELGESSEFPASKILTEKTVHRYVSLNDKVGAEEATGAPKPKAASKKRLAAVLGDEPVVKKKRTTKKRTGSSKASLEMVAVAQEAVPIQIIEPISVAPAADESFEQLAAENEFPADQPTDEVTDPSTADDVDVIIEQVLADTAQIRVDEEDLEVDASADEGQPAGTTAEKHWFDLPYEDLMARLDAERPVVTASDTNEDMEQVFTETDTAETTVGPETDVGTVGTDVGDEQAQLQLVEEADEEMSGDGEQAVDDHIDADEAMSLEDILMTILVDIPLPSAGVEITKITMGKEIKIPGVERTRYLAILPQIPVDNKGNFKKLATINVEEISKKEEQVLYWGETETIRVALNRKMYILLKYREVLVRKFLESWKKNFVPGEGSSATDLKLISMLSDQHLFALEELKEQALAHSLTWTNTCCSKIFEGSPRDLGAVIARNNTNTPSKCWIRTMIRVDGVWTVEPCCDQWSKVQLLRIQMDIDLSDDSSLHFDDNDAAAASISLPAAPIPNVTEALAQLRASIEQISERDDGAKHKDTLLLHLHDFERQVTTRFDAQDRVLGALRKDSNDQINLMSLDIKSSHKQLSTHIANTDLDVVYVRRVVRENHQVLE
ncbi:dystroglycan-like [Dorcoceras hygrometricum]|uniref:Dystroglycan-like n=1 Tax=Dorcoceras hygrometricum TaxID=472368 RepID=A0A2Z7A953_9LAMI|nr:dystroglycan-like [Dorcoceras hygrometricum]